MHMTRAAPMVVEIVNECDVEGAEQEEQDSN